VEPPDRCAYRLSHQCVSNASAPRFTARFPSQYRQSLPTADSEKKTKKQRHFRALFIALFIGILCLLIDSPNSCPLKRLPARKRPNFLLLFSRRNTGAGVTGT
jgi:hypothetical protein